MDINNNIVEENKDKKGKCQDSSRYCDIFKIFQSCHDNEVREKCCLTCAFHS